MARNSKGSSGSGSTRSSSSSNRSSSGRGGSSSNRSRNNNPSGRNQYSGSGVMDLARDRPVAAAAVAAGAAAAGLFLWSKRAQISEQLSSLSDQIGEWTDNMMSSDSSGDWNDDDDTAGLTTASGTSETGMSASGGRNRTTQPTIG
jgi:hypothetical protein